MVWQVSDYIKANDDWNSWTWSCTAFKTWKKRLKEKYLEEIWRPLNADVPCSWDREALYKRIFQMEWLDIFWNENVNQTQARKVDSTILDTCKRIRDLI